MRRVSPEQLMRACVIGAIALGLLAVPLLFPNFLVYQFSLVLTYAIAILGLNLLMGFNGQISVAHGVFFAVGGYTTAIFMTRYGMNYLATLPLAAATSALFGLVVGVPALRWQGLPLAFITFGLAVLVPPIALKLEPITKGATGISMPKPEPPAWFPGSQDTFIYLICLAGMAICVLIAWRLTRGDTGRSLRAVRDNGLIAESLGMNLATVRLAAFTTSAGFAGVGGGLFAIVNAYVKSGIVPDDQVVRLPGRLDRRRDHQHQRLAHRRAVHRVPARVVGRHEHRAVRPDLWRRHGGDDAHRARRRGRPGGRPHASPARAPRRAPHAISDGTAVRPQLQTDGRKA